MSFSGIAITSFEVRAMPVEDLWPPVGTVPVFVDEVKESVKQKGLMNPIIVVRLPREDVINHFTKVSHALTKVGSPPKSFPPGPVINVIWGGSNRLEAVKQLGYKHVDCVLIPCFQVAMQIQDLQRNAYKKSREGETDGSAGQTTD